MFGLTRRLMLGSNQAVLLHLHNEKSGAHPSTFQPYSTSHHRLLLET